MAMPGMVGALDACPIVGSPARTVGAGCATARDRGTACGVLRFDELMHQRDVALIESDARKPSLAQLSQWLSADRSDQSLVQSRVELFRSFADAGLVRPWQDRAFFLGWTGPSGRPLAEWPSG